MSSPHPELLPQVRDVLTLAGFQLVDGPESAGPGLRVRLAPAGVLVTWSASHTLTESPGRTRNPLLPADSMAAAVQSAVAGLLFHLGFSVSQLADPDDVTLLVRDVRQHDERSLSA